MRKLERRLALLALGTIGVRFTSAASMYTWRDGSGGVHYSNAPVTTQRAVKVEDPDPPANPDAPPAAPTRATIDGEDETQPGEQGTQPIAATEPTTDDRERFSTEASSRRRGLEKTFRAARQRLAAIEGQLAALGKTRTQHAARGTHANDVVADEERPLLSAKATIEREIEDTRGAYGALATEVTTRLGGLPDWWSALR
jgi:Domain of unknown function (DUF4124)